MVVKNFPATHGTLITVFRRAATEAFLECLCTQEDLPTTAAGSKQMETYLYWKITPVHIVQSENKFEVTSNKHKRYKAKNLSRNNNLIEFSLF
jgi:hypothetical protein